jgi:cytochrome c oxidase subunit 2
VSEASVNEDLPLLPSQASEIASGVDLLLLFLIGTGVLFVIGFFAIVLLASLRRDPAARGLRVLLDRPLHWITALWIVVPSTIVLAAFSLSVHLQAAHSVAPSASIRIRGVGRQWLWFFRHEQGPTEVGELHVPVDVPVVLHLNSGDVLHTFTVPAFRIRQEVLPGRETELWFRATRTGSFRFVCGDYCGPGHSTMTGTIQVLDPIAYERWVNGDAADLPPEEGGKLLFTAFRCDSCHKTGGGGTGPALEGAFGHEVELSDGTKVLFDEAYVRESIFDPNAKTVKGFTPAMSSFKGQLNENQIAQITAYLKSLSGAAPPKAK